MRSHPGPRQLSIAVAAVVAFVLVPLLAVGLAAAQAPEETINVGPTPPEINNPTGDESVVDPDEIGEPVVGPDDVDAELPNESKETETAPTDSGGDSSSTTSEGSDGAPTSVRDVPLARTGFPGLALASLGGVSLLTGLRLLGLRRV
jgi:hypothetical protein